MNPNEIRALPCGAYQTNAYLVCPDGRADAFLIDPGDDLALLRRAIADSGRRLSAILLTHGHFDHMLAAEPLRRETGAEVFVSAADAELLTDPVKNAFNREVSVLELPKMLPFEALEDEIEVCGAKMQVLSTPGHTRGSVCFYEKEGGVLFSGDTLFQAGYGRTDLYGGDMFALARSLKTLLTLPEDTRVLPGHGGETTIGAERRRYRL